MNEEEGRDDRALEFRYQLERCPGAAFFRERASAVELEEVVPSRLLMDLPPCLNSAVTALVATVLFLAGGCASMSGSPSVVARGVDDYANQYRSTVRVYAPARDCDGVLIALHLVLTSASCFCLPPSFEARAGTSVYTAAQCERTAFVHLVRYVRQWDGKWRGIPESFEGTVTVHENFRAEVQDGKVVSGLADLAVVEMEYSMWGVLPDGDLPEAEVAPHERLVEVGFGPSAPRGEDEGARRFAGTVVTSVSATRETPEVRFRTSRVQGLSGDSGGPCFRETAKGRRLVGINSGLAQGQGTWFTSTFYYRGWIERQKSR